MTTTNAPPSPSLPRRLAREPLLHFAIIGLTFYLLSLTGGADSQGREIVVTQGDVARIQASFQQQFGQPPTAGQMQQLLDHWIREEIFWREGRALGLDQGDEIVRRRVAQKFEFLQQDLALPAAPSEDDLQDYFQRHGERYRIPARVSMQHIFIAFAGDTEQRIAELAAQLHSNPSSEGRGLGDRFPGESVMTKRSAEELSHSFGDSAIVTAAFAAPLARWHGPVDSGYGRHFIRITERSDAQLPTLDAVANRVRADWLSEQRQALNSAAFDKLRGGYRIRIEGEN